ncbi:MAG: primosome assembly protein PriA, partial [Dermatophilaceae bacterium]|nr:primosome assembly protein PriA [Dermatophilaceae bacterium]
MGDDETTQRPAFGPVAAVVVETPLAHLDRVFEYSVPAELDVDAVPGARVRVRFSGRELDGFVVERREAPQHDGRLTPLRRVVSPEPVLTPEVLALSRAVADRYAGTQSDVL